MGKLKVIRIAVTVIIMLIIVKGNCYGKITNCNCEKIIFANSKERIEIPNKLYRIELNARGYEIIILDSSFLRRVRTIQNPKIEFCIQKKKIQSFGNPIFSSSIPRGAKSFYAFSGNDSTIFFSDQNKISISDVSKVSRKFP